MLMKLHTLFTIDIKTILIEIAYYLIELNWSLTTKSSILIIGTFSLSWRSNKLLIGPWRYIRPFFGLKKNSN